jgi:hypothetical protein
MHGCSKHLYNCAASGFSASSDIASIRKGLAMSLSLAAGVVGGIPKILLRTEGALALAAASLAYGKIGGGWTMFALLFLAPDLFMLGYLADPKRGAAIYNLGHTYILPALLTSYGLFGARPLPLEIGLIWIAHIGFDRLLGFGLKYQTAFRHSHLSGG